MKNFITTKSCLAAALSLTMAVGLYAEDTPSSQNKNNPLPGKTANEYGKEGAQKGQTRAGARVSQSTMPQEYNKATKLLGMAVHDSTGNKLGDIKDLVLDTKSGRVSYAVFGTDGKERKFAIPLNAFQPGENHRHLTLKVDQSKFESAQGIEGDNWPAIGTRSFGNQFWHASGTPTQNPQLGQAPGVDSDAVQETPRSTEITPTGKLDSERSSGQQMAPTDLNKATKLISMNIKDSQNESVGEIKDLVIDLQTGRVAYAVLSHGGLLGANQKLAAVPLKAFTHSADQKSLMLNASKDQLASIPAIEKDSWPSLTNTDFGSNPFWHTSETGTPNSLNNRGSDQNNQKPGTDRNDGQTQPRPGSPRLDPAPQPPQK